MQGKTPHSYSRYKLPRWDWGIYGKFKGHQSRLVPSEDSPFSVCEEASKWWRRGEVTARGGRCWRRQGDMESTSSEQLRGEGLMISDFMAADFAAGS